jgi:hypothetical protein
LPADTAAPVDQSSASHQDTDLGRVSGNMAADLTFLAEESPLVSAAMADSALLTEISPMAGSALLADSRLLCGYSRVEVALEAGSLAGLQEAGKIIADMFALVAALKETKTGKIQKRKEHLKLHRNGTLHNTALQGKSQLCIPFLGIVQP